MSVRKNRKKKSKTKPTTSQSSGRDWTRPAEIAQSLSAEASAVLVKRASLSSGLHTVLEIGRQSGAETFLYDVTLHING